MSKPGFFFYTGDWLKDTRCLTIEARGCWMDWLCMLHEHDGEIEWPVSAFGQYCGIGEELARSILYQLHQTNVANVEWQNDSKTLAKLSNRRMVKEVQKRAETKGKRVEAGKKGAEVRWQKCGSSSSESPSESFNHNPKKAEIPAEPAPSADLPKVRESRKLDEVIKASADPIYKSNPEKFARLIVWIKEKEKRDYPVEVITTTLRLFWEYEQKSKIADWWPYINRIFSKQYGRWNEEQAANHKAADSDFVRNLVRATAGVLKS